MKTLNCLMAILVMSWSALAAEVKLLNTAGEPVAGMAVYLTPTGETKARVDNMAPVAEVHQTDKQFSPYITLVQQGTEVNFINDDDITHHIYSALGPKRFSFKLKPESAPQSVHFTAAGTVAMGCNIHDWMSGYLLVVDTPLFGLTDEQGSVNFPEIPAGSYTLVVWHPQLETEDNRVTTMISAPLSALFTLVNEFEMAPLPVQKSLDDFDFLEGY